MNTSKNCKGVQEAGSYSSFKFECAAWLRAFACLSLAFFAFAAQAQIPTRFVVNPGFEQFVVNGVLNPATTGAQVVAACPGWTGGGNWPTFGNTGSTSNARVYGWRSTDLGPNAFGNACGTGAEYFEIFSVAQNPGAGSARSGNFYNHNNPNQVARDYQLICMAPGDRPIYSYTLRGRNDLNERYAVGLWTTANIGTYVASSAGAVAGNTANGGNLFAVDNAVTSTSAWQLYTQATKPFPGLVAGLIPNTFTPGTYAFGVQTSNGSSGVAGGFGGDTVSGPFSDDVNFLLRPLIDLTGFSVANVGEGAGNTLRIRINGRLGSTATAIIRNVSSAAAPGARYGVDFSVTAGVTSKAGVTTSVNAAGDITVTLPAGDYDPNTTVGSVAGLIDIPFTTINDTTVEALENVRYTLGNTAITVGLDVTDVSGGTGVGEGQHPDGLAVQIGTNGVIGAGCVVPNKVAAFTITDNDKPTLTKAFGAASIASGAVTTLTFTITNPADTSPTSTDRIVVAPIVFTDNLPANITIANSTVTLGAGCTSTSVPTVSAGATSFVVSAANNVGVSNTPSPGAVACTITVNVTATIQNASCATNPAAFTNTTTSVTGITAASNVINGVTNQCLVVTPPAATLVVTKTDSKAATTSGATNNYVVTLTNQGPSPANGAVLTDVPVLTGLNCPPANLVVCTVIGAGAICPSPLTIASLTGGLTIATLPANGALQFAFSCNVN